jgi:alpha-mannosidase
MRNELEFDAQRFRVFASQVLEPAVYPTSVPLAAAAFQCPDPIPHDEAVQAAYEPVEIGWRWGPVWSTAWFRLTGRVPPKMSGRPLALRFSCGTEALLWQAGIARQGFDDNHDSVVLCESATSGEELCLHVEAACNHPLGTAKFFWQEAEFNRRWDTPQPGILERCELAVYDPLVWQLWRTYDFARQLLLLLPEDSQRGQELCETLRRTTERIGDTNVPASAEAALEILTSGLREHAGTATSSCIAIGHAHIDTAWLWRIRETRRKCIRSFATALELMNRFPEFRFVCSQAQQYEWIEQDAPELFERIAARVRDGHWEAGGAVWVEPDCNVPAGESLVRQILCATRYWQQKFGPAAPQRFLFLPDTFGFSGALPQIMAQAGLDTFITNKLCWNDTNEFPHMNFRWRGIDGTEVLAHATPGKDYNAVNSPTELTRGAKNAARKDRARTGIWLQPFGYGDGGGGPTDWTIHNALLAEQCTGLPKARIDRVSSVCDELHQCHETLRAKGRDLPLWDGELYLEYHRGTYTTQAWLKRANRRAEQGLRVAEWLTFAGPTSLSEQEHDAARAQLDEAWKLLLLNQFHDILPGSSITAVYDDARAQHERLRGIYETLIDDGVRRWSGHADTCNRSQPMIVLNPCSHQRTGVVECDGRLHWVADVPAMGMTLLDRADQPPTTPVRVERRVLSNGLLTATIDEAGQVTSLKRCGSERDARARGVLNQLVLYDDRPRGWDAWDIDEDYADRAFPVTGPAATWRVIADGPLRAAIEVSRPLGSGSKITQRFTLEAGSPRLDIATSVDWHEEHRLLRALFPVDVRARHATYEIQFGHLERPTHRNTPWDQARFEVCAHRWMDLSEPGFGVALLNDCKYGHSCRENVLGLSLLRSPKFPDPRADLGRHEFTYSLIVHDGDWRAAGVDRQAEALNNPLIVRPLPAGSAGTTHDRWTPFELAAHGPVGVEIVAVKRAADDDRLILRLVETHGGRGHVTVAWNLPVVGVQCVDLLERPSSNAEITHDSPSRRTTVPLRPFQIVTLAAQVQM